MKRKYFLATGLFIIFMTTFYLYKATSPEEVVISSTIEEEKSLEYFDKEIDIPANTVALTTNVSTTGQAFVLLEQDNTSVYLSYVYPNFTPKPEIVSYQIEDRNLVIKVKPAVIKEGAIGLTVMSYHYFKIEINQEVEKVVLDETK
jgi:hypothetical protein